MDFVELPHCFASGMSMEAGYYVYEYTGQFAAETASQIAAKGVAAVAPDLRAVFSYNTRGDRLLKGIQDLNAGRPIKLVSEHVVNPLIKKPVRDQVISRRAFLRKVLPNKQKLTL